LAAIEHCHQYQQYQALRLTPHYQEHDQRTRAVEATSKHYRVTLATVYRALRLMQQLVSPIGNWIRGGANAQARLLCIRSWHKATACAI
jgi:hypothetical protein